MPAWSGMGHVCKLAIASTGRTKIAFDLRRVVVVVNHRMLEDRVNHRSF